MIVKTVTTTYPSRALMFDGSIELEFNNNTLISRVQLTPSQADSLISQLEVWLRECKEIEQWQS